jgi:hypothetical protein
VKVTLLLADMGQNDPTGKLNILGAGWNITAVGPAGVTPDAALAVFIEAPWDRCNRPLEIVLDLVSEDDEPVVVPLGTEPGPLRITHSLVAVPAPGAPNGSPGFNSFLINLRGGLPLAPGNWYRWRAFVDKEHEGSWEARFYVQRQQTAPTFGPGGSGAPVP